VLFDSHWCEDAASVVSLVQSSDISQHRKAARLICEIVTAKSGTYMRVGTVDDSEIGTERTKLITASSLQLIMKLLYSSDESVLKYFMRALECIVNERTSG